MYRSCLHLVCRAEREVSVPLGVAYQMWDTKTRIPEWMPIIDSVVVCSHAQLYYGSFSCSWHDTALACSLHCSCCVHGSACIDSQVYGAGIDVRGTR